MLDINKVRFPFIGIKFVRQLAASEWLLFQPAAMVYLFGRREQERMKDRKQLAWANTTVCVNQAEHSVFWNQPWSESLRRKKKRAVYRQSHLQKVYSLDETIDKAGWGCEAGGRAYDITDSEKYSFRR